MRKTAMGQVQVEDSLDGVAGNSGCRDGMGIVE